MIQVTNISHEEDVATDDKRIKEGILWMIYALNLTTQMKCSNILNDISTKTTIVKTKSK